jgi:hypothetical protein
MQALEDFGMILIHPEVSPDALLIAEMDMI